MKTVKQNLIDLSLDIQNISANDANTIGFMPTVFVNASLPHSEIHQNKYVRENGRYKITYFDPHNVGLPYGSLARILTVWIAQHAIQSKEKRIHLDSSLASFMRSMNIHSTGGSTGSIRRFKKQFVSLLSCVIACENKDDKSVSLETMTLSNRQLYWWSQQSEESANYEGAYVELSDEFYQRIEKSAVPVDIRALNLLRKSPLALDIYIWLTYKMATIKKIMTISYKQLLFQFGAGYPNSKKGLNHFQQAFKKQLSYVLVVYSKANIELLPGRVQLRPGEPHINKIHTP